MGLNTKADYGRLYQQLLPEGLVWPTDLEAILSRLALGLSDGPAHLEERGQDLLDELDPRTTDELLEDWERVLGLPSACTGPLETREQRRKAVLFRLTALGGQSPAYLIDIADRLGFRIEIEEHWQVTCEGNCEQELTGEEWLHTFTVHARPDVSETATCESTCIVPLEWFNNAVLECAIAEVKPAHTHALFAYDLDVILPVTLTLQVAILPPTIS